MPVALSLHIVFLVIWSAALLYFPYIILFEECQDQDERRRQAIQLQRTLYAFVMTPSAVLTVLTGIWLIFERGFGGGWLPLKLALVLLMVIFHTYCGTLMVDLKHQQAQHRMLFYRALTLLPVLLITATLTMVLAKPV